MPKPHNEDDWLKMRTQLAERVKERFALHLGDGRLYEAALCLSAYGELGGSILEPSQRLKALYEVENGVSL